MSRAKSNTYGITHAGYATDTQGKDTRTQLKDAGVSWRETEVSIKAPSDGVVTIVTYANQINNRPVSVLLVPFVLPDNVWYEEYYAMANTDHEAALAKPWNDIIDDVLTLYHE